VVEVFPAATGGTRGTALQRRNPAEADLKRVVCLNL
jgi:hypothetical protein